MRKVDEDGVGNRGDVRAEVMMPAGPKSESLEELPLKAAIPD